MIHARACTQNCSGNDLSPCVAVASGDDALTIAPPRFRFPLGASAAIASSVTSERVTGQRSTEPKQERKPGVIPETT